MLGNCHNAFRIGVCNPLMLGQANFDGWSSMVLERRCGVIFARILKIKIPMERSFPNLNEDTLFVGLEFEL